MELYRILQDIMAEQKLTIADTARICSLPDSTVRGIITRKQRSTALDVAFKLSDGLNVSLERLNGLSEREIKKFLGTAETEPRETKLIELYRELNYEGRELLVDYADTLVVSEKYIKSSTSELDQKKA